MIVGVTSELNKKNNSRMIELNQKWSGSVTTRIEPHQALFLALVSISQVILFSVVTIMFMNKQSFIFTSCFFLVVLFFSLMGTISFFGFKYPHKMYQIMLDFQHSRYEYVLKECHSFIDYYSKERTIEYNMMNRDSFLGLLKPRGKEFLIVPHNYVVGIFHTWYLHGKKVTRLAIRNVDEKNMNVAIQFHIELDKFLFSKKIIGKVLGGGESIRYKEENGIFVEIADD